MARIINALTVCVIRLDILIYDAISTIPILIISLSRGELPYVMSLCGNFRVHSTDNMNAPLEMQ